MGGIVSVVCDVREVVVMSGVVCFFFFLEVGLFCGVELVLMGELGVKLRVVFILVDGLGDVGIFLLGFKFFVEVVKMFNLDVLVSGGISGLMDFVELGLGCGSDIVYLFLLGYNFRIYYCGCGVFEFFGVGLVMVFGDIVFKVCVFCVFEFNWV